MGVDNKVIFGFWERKKILLLCFLLKILRKYIRERKYKNKRKEKKRLKLNKLFLFTILNLFYLF